MGVWITGYLPGDNEDQFIQYEVDVDEGLNDRVLKLLGYASIDDFDIGMWPLTEHQVREISRMLDRSLPSDLEIFISVIRD